VLFFFIIFTNLIVSASAITISYSTGESGESVSSSVAYDLDDSTSLKESTILNGASIVQDQKASGSGKNAISKSLTGNGYSIKNSIANRGSFDSQASVAATSNEASYIQGISGEGETKVKQMLGDSDNRLESEVGNFGALSISSAATVSQSDSSLDQSILGGGHSTLSLDGTRGSANLLQQASVSDGLLSSIQRANAGPEVLLNQRTKVDGASGIVGTRAIDQDNNKIAMAQYTNEGKIDAELSATAAKTVDIGGEIALNGVTWLDDKTLDGIGSEHTGMDIQGLREASGGDVGSFQVVAANFDPKFLKQTSLDGVPNEDVSDIALADSPYQVYYGNHYALWNYRLNRKDPKVTFELNPQYLPLDKQATINSLGWAAWTWDAGVYDYAGADTVLFDIPNFNVITNDNSAKPVDSELYDVHQPGSSNGDGNVIGWRPFVSGADDLNVIAYCQNYLNEDPFMGGYYNIAESDLVFNANERWSNSEQSSGSGTYDVQAVALHEMGHAIGLADLYEPGDAEQVMYGYDAHRRDLNDGDIAGLKKLYDWRPVALSANNGQHVVAENGGGQAVNANRPWIGAWENFDLITAWPGWGEDKYVLRASNGQFVCAENGGGTKLVANRDNARAWETFKLEDLGNGNIRLKADNGQYVCAENGGGRELVANRNVPGAWETFKVSNLRSYTWTSMTSEGNMKFVCAENGGQSPLVANRDNFGTWEGFDLIPLTSNTIAIRAKANGRFVCAENGGGSELIANRDWIGSWETFTFKNLGRDTDNFPIYTLKANNGQYVRIDPSRYNKLYADMSGSDSDWERFRWDYDIPSVP
jgi:hypothetical protein